MNKIKKIVINYFPYLGKVKRFVKALYFCAVKYKTYSQHGEDLAITKILKDYELSQINYIDVGCNHPMDISNTFLFYRHGAKGICIDANKEFRYLYKYFRKRDLFFPIGIGSKCEMANFHISKTPVISGFQNSILNERSEYVPILTLDLACCNLDLKKITLLNIDVEGLNFEVLKGAFGILKLTEVVCIEFDDEIERESICKFLLEDFLLVEELSCNLLFQRKSHL